MLTIIFIILSVIIGFCSGILCESKQTLEVLKMAKRQNEEWSDLCEKQNKEWAEYCERLIDKIEILERNKI